MIFLYEHGYAHTDSTSFLAQFQIHLYPKSILHNTYNIKTVV